MRLPVPYYKLSNFHNAQPYPTRLESTIDSRHSVYPTCDLFKTTNVRNFGKLVLPSVRKKSTEGKWCGNLRPGNENMPHDLRARKRAGSRQDGENDILRTPGQAESLKGKLDLGSVVSQAFRPVRG